LTASRRVEPGVRVTEADIRVELDQCRDEGKPLERLEEDAKDLLKRLDTSAGQAAARRWFAKTLDARERGVYAGEEPSDLPGIRTLRPRAPRELDADLSSRRLLDRIHGAWLGRCCGCYLGKPVEGVRRSEIHTLLKSQHRFPLSGYFRPPAPRSLVKNGGRWADFPSTYGKRFMPEDDDTNYTTIGLAIVQSRGADFTSDDVARFWLANVPFSHTYTAERVAYRNLAMGLQPPNAKTGRQAGVRVSTSADYVNPYREWIGAQIRADAFGYVNVGRPERAAEFAFRDAAVSHVKNGLYSEMWVAAMLAWAYVLDDPRAVLLAGLNEIPLRCRLADAVRHVVQMYDNGLSADEAVADIHARWDEANRHHWCHTISNAEIVAYALLWGEMDFGRTICLAVDAAFDTDCNGATAGSVLGMLLGARRLPKAWTAQLADTLKTGVAGFYDVRISQMAKRTAALAKALHANGKRHRDTESRK
jgi:hypothetical protein